MTPDTLDCDRWIFLQIPEVTPIGRKRLATSAEKKTCGVRRPKNASEYHVSCMEASRTVEDFEELKDRCIEECLEN